MQLWKVLFTGSFMRILGGVVARTNGFRVPHRSGGLSLTDGALVFRWTCMSEVWYQAGLSFQCTGCGNCCSGPQTGFVWVSDQGIAAIAEIMNMGDDIDRFERQFVRTIGNRKSLVEYSDGDCIFLDPTL